MLSLRLCSCDSPAPTSRHLRNRAHQKWASSRSLGNLRQGPRDRQPDRELGSRADFAANGDASSMRSNRVLPFPFHFLNNNGAMNVKPANYSWRTLYDHIIDLTRYSFSTRTIFRRLRSED